MKILVMKIILSVVLAVLTIGSIELASGGLTFLIGMCK